MRLPFATFLFTATFLIAAAPQAPAQSAGMQQVDSALARIKRQLGPRYAESRTNITAIRSDSMPYPKPLTPSAGTYVFAGAGDANTTGFAMRLYDANNRVVAADTSGSATPRFTYTVTTNGAYYRLELILTGCRQAPCYFGVQPFQRR